MSSTSCCCPPPRHQRPPSCCRHRHPHARRSPRIAPANILYVFPRYPQAAAPNFDFLVEGSVRCSWHHLSVRCSWHRLSCDGGSGALQPRLQLFCIVFRLHQEGRRRPRRRPPLGPHLHRRPHLPPVSRDIRLLSSVTLSIESLTLTFHGHDLLVDIELELNYGRRYGLLSLNGCGKSCLLKAIGCRELPIPEHMDIYHLSHEIEASDMSALGAVISCDEERVKLEKEAEVLAAQDDGGGAALERVYERLEAIDASTAEKCAAVILFVLGFNKQMQAKKTRDFSGGWLMRIALARALFMNPTILLLDWPTYHLDLEACVWLEETLKKFDRILVVISQDFQNGVCTSIIHVQNRKLKLYTGYFDQYVQTRSELEEDQMKQYRWEQDQIMSMKEYIARFEHGSAKLARQAQSKEKTLAKMEHGWLTEKVVRDRILTFRFANVGKLLPPVLQFVEVTFGYMPDNLIYKKLDFGVDLDSRVVLVGPNGAGKSMLLRLITTELVALDGMLRRHNHLRIAQFHQHLAEKLDLDLSALHYMLNDYLGNEEERMRAVIGRFRLSGKAHVMPMRNLSDGQRSRVIFAWLAWREP